MMMELDYSDLPDVNQKQSSPVLDFSDLPDDKTAQKQSFVDAQLTTKAITPQQAVQAKQASSQFNIPFLNAVQNPDIVADRKIVEGNTYDDLATRAPKTATFLQDPVNAAIAKDDHESLAKVEGFWATLKALPNAIAEGAKGAYWQDENKIYFDKFVNPFRKELVKKPAFLGERPTHAVLNASQELQLQKSEKGMTRYGEATDRLKDNTTLDFAQYTGYGVGQLAIMGKNMISVPFNNEAIGAGAALAGATMAASSAFPEIAPLAKAAQVAQKAFKYGAVAFVGSDSFKQNANEAHKLYVGLKDETGKPLPKDIVQTAALATGGINALLDVTSVVALEAMFSPAVSSALKAMGKEKVKAKVADMLVRESTRKLIMKWGETAGGVAVGEGAIEGAQDLIKNIGREIAQDYATENRGNAEFKSPTLTEPLRGKDGEIIEQSYGASAWDNVKMGSKATLFMGMAGAGINTHAQIALHRDIAAFKNERTNLDLMNQAVTESPSMTLDPSLRTRLMQHLGLDGNAQELYMDANKTRDLFQSFEGVTDPVEEVRKMFGDETAKNFAEALNTSSDFAVPADAFVTEVMGTKLYDSVKDFTRVNPHSLTQEDIANFEAKQQEYAKQFAETERNIKENGMTDPVKRVYDDVYGQVKGLSDKWLSDKDMQDYALIHATHAATRSSNLFNGDHSQAWNLYEPYQLSIKNEAKRVSDLKQGKFNNDIDPLLNEMRAGTTKAKQQAIYGKSLMDSLRAKGLTDVGGELAARDVDKNLKPFQRKLIRADGIDLDVAASWAAENGYIKNADTNELLDAIDSEMFDNPVYSDQVQNSDLADRENKIAHIQSIFDKMGIDIHSKTNDELRDILTGDNTLYQQEQALKLMITHNLTEGNLLHAAKLGGLPVPSLAIVNANSPLDSFGEITLLGSKEMADPKGYAKTKVYGADIYSPRYPRVIYKLTQSAVDKIHAKLREINALVGGRLPDKSEIESYGAKELSSSSAVKALFLKEKGLSFDVATKEVAPLPDFLMTFTEGKLSADQLRESEEFKKAVIDNHNSLTDKLLAEETDADARERYREALELTDIEMKRVIRSNAFKVTSYREQIKEKGTPDNYKTKNNIEKVIEDKNLQPELEKFSQGLLSSMNPEEKIHKGNQKFIPHTIENVIKILKTDLRGGEGFNYRIGSLRAKFTPEFKSIKQIREEGSRLLDSESFAKVKDEIELELQFVVDSISRNGKTVSEDTALGILEDIPKFGMNKVIKDYDVDISEEGMQSIVEFLTRLESMPTEYFEAKILRSVDVSEFSGAVIPANATQETRDILTNAGVQFREYQEGQRAKVLRELAYDLSEQGKNTLFQEEQKQIDAVRAQYEGTDQWMKAPNGEDTKLNEIQWLQVRTPNFKAWFGDFENDPKNASKVVDENGEPLVVYHGTDVDFSVFLKEKLGSATKAMSAQQGFFFTKSSLVASGYSLIGVDKVRDKERTKQYTKAKKDIDEASKELDAYGMGGYNYTLLSNEERALAEQDKYVTDRPIILEQMEKLKNAEKELAEADIRTGANVNPVFLNIRDMFVHEQENDTYRDEKYSIIVNSAKTKGQDGVVIKNTRDPASYRYSEATDIFVVFEPEQIKSATGNTGEFSASNPNILYQSEKGSIPIYRIDAQGFDNNIIKPHGLYVSIPSDVSTFDSPHKEVGDTSFSGYATPKNPLNVDSVKIQHKRGNNYPMETSAGVSALKQLVEAKLFDYLIKADKAELTATIKEQFPDIDTRQYHDAYELLEVLGAQLAKQDGYDAIIQKVEGDPMNEMVILDNSIIGDLSNQKLEQSAKGYLTIKHNRKMDITLTGNANFSTFLHESGHLWLEMMKDDLQHPNVTEAMKSDWNVLSKWFSDYSVTALKEIQGDVKSIEQKIKTLSAKAKLSDAQQKELAELQYHLESHNQALDYIESNADKLKDVALDFGASVVSERVRNVLTKPFHEQFARGMESYFREGKAPSVALESTFANFANWLQNVIYKTMQMLGVNLTDDVRGVMDRMFATDAEIKQAKEIQNIEPIFGKKIPTEMTEADKIKYVRLLAESESDAKRKLFAEVLKSKRQAEEEKYQLRLAEIRKEIEKQLNVQPSQIAMYFLRTGQFREGAEPLYPVEPVKLDRAELVDTFGESYLKDLPKGSYTTKNGIHYDELAEALGFESGRKMLQDIINDPLKTETKRNQYLDEQAGYRMRDENPELITQQAMTEEAQKAIHSDKRAQVLINEMENLSKISGKKATPASMLKAYADKIISYKAVQDIRPSIYQRAEAAANLKTIAHVAKEEYAEALEAREIALLNHYLFSKALESQADYKKRLDHIKRYLKTSVRKNIAAGGAESYLVIINDSPLPTKFTSKAEAQKQADIIPDSYVTTNNTYLEMIDSVLGEYDIKKMPAWAIKFSDAMNDLISELQEMGEPVPELASLPAKKNIHRLSYADFVQVDNLLTIIERISTGSKQLNTIRGRMDLADIISEMRQSSAGVTSKKIKMSRHKHALDKLIDAKNAYVEYQTRIDVYNSILDGEQEQGPFHDMFLVPSRNAHVKKEEMKTEMELRLKEIFTPVYEEFSKSHILGDWNPKNIFKRDIDAFMGHSIYIESLDSYESVQTIIGWAQLYGHQGGRDALLHSDNIHQLTEEGILEAIGKLTDIQLDAVEKIVKLNNSYWSRLEALDKRTKGYAAPKVEPLPYMVGDRMMSGGYSRLAYDGKDSIKVRFQDMADGLKNVFSQSNNKTNAGSTNKRTGSGGKPPRYDFSLIHENLVEVIHDLTHREFVMNAQKIIKDKGFQDLVSQKINPEAANQYQLWINNRGVPDKLPTHGFERFLGFANNSSTIMFIGMNTFNFLQNLTGIAVGTVLVGEKYMLMSTAKLASSPVAIYKFVDNLSPMMAERAKSFGNRDAARTLQADSSFTGKNKWVAESAFIGQRLVQEVVDKLVWHGAYQKAMDGNVEGIDVLDQVRAIQYADRVIEQTQGGAGGYSQANVFEKNEFVRLFTLLGGYMNQMYALSRIVHNKGRYKPIPKRVFSEMMAAFYIMILPTLITAWMRAGKDDDDSWWKWAEKNKVIGQLVSYPASFFILARPLVTTLLNPTFDFKFSPSEGAFQALADGMRGGVKMVDALFSDEEDAPEIKRRDVKNVVNAAGYLLHLPTRGMIKSGEPLYDYLNGDYTPEDNLELTRSILLGKPK